MKPCSNCFIIKPLSEFYAKREKRPNNRIIMGYQSRCKDCNAEVVKAYNKRARQKRIQAGWDKLHGRTS